MRKLLGVSNAKTSKGEELGYITGILYLAPATMVEGLNLCPFATAGCKQACLFSAGRGKFSNVRDARISKTVLYRDNKPDFFKYLIADIKRGVKRATKLGKQFVVRLNGTSDICWENIYLSDGKNIFDTFPDVQFYDYTKDFTRLDALTGKWGNYHLTFSQAESTRNKAEAAKLLKLGVNVAIVFSNRPTEYNGNEVIDGDKHDLRFLDKRGVIVGLTAKGDAKHDKSGFVVRG